jgi:F-type H+-transporting ATPase subunit b
MRTRLSATLAAGLLALIALFGFAGPAHAQEEGGETGQSEEGVEGEHELSHDTEECIEQAEAADDPEACNEAPSPILPPVNELIWGSISFVILFAVLAKFAFPAAKKGMEARTERIKNDLEGAESAKTEANRVLDEYRAQLADAKAEAGRIIEEARQQGDAVRREQEQRLQTELASMRERAAADVESAKAQAIADLRGEVANLAIGAAEVVVGKNLDRDTQTQLVDQYIASIQNRN